MFISSETISVLTTSSSVIAKSDYNVLKLLFQSVIFSLQRLQSNFTVQDIEFFIYAVSFLRFILYAIFYNIRTGFFIACISFIAAKFWYAHFIYILEIHGRSMMAVSFTRSLWVSYISQQKDRIDLTLGDTTNLLFIKILGNIDNSHRIDPISMIFASMPAGIKAYTDKIYYTLVQTIFPYIINTLFTYSYMSKMLFSYFFIARYGKKNCPYLIRWHWTYVVLYTVITPFLIYLPIRLEDFAKFTLLDQGRLNEFVLAYVLIGFTVTLHLLAILFPLFHAVLGQYFYIPFLTENVEAHIGKRPKNSIYSGGYTAWQDADIFLNIQNLGLSDKKNKPLIPKLWWGWFGRGSEPTIRKSSQRRQRKLFKKLRNFFKNLFK